LHDSTARVLKDSNHTVVALVEAGVVAKVATSKTRVDAPEALARELDIARYLSQRGAPITHPLEGDAAGPYLVRDAVVTLWRFYEDTGEPAESDAMVGAALRSLHEAFAEYQGILPSFEEKLSQATALISNPTATSKLADEDRTLLLKVGEGLRRGFDEVKVRTRPLHGEPHSENMLWTSGGPLFLDFEGSIRGPQEWDLAYVSEAALSAFPIQDAEMLRLCRRATSYCVAAWCWADPDRAPELRAAAEYHLGALRSALGNGV
jgi:Ser/Thr protein kinase RdoA (MazF antagonist)